MPEECPPPGTPCVVIDCAQPSAFYVHVGPAADLESDDRGVAMCDEHAAHWRDGDVS